MQLIPKKFPIDLDNRKIVGFRFPLNGNAVFNPTYQTKDQIKANLINYMLTNKGERIFNPEFGANLRDYVFNIIDTKDQDEIKQRIQGDIKLYFPDVVINELKFNNQTDKHIVNLILNYSIRSFGIEDNINIFIQ